MFKRKSYTAKAIAMRTARALVVGVFTLCAVGYMVSQTPTAVMVAPEQAPHSEALAPVKGSPAFLMEKHNCWTGEAPAGIGEFGPSHAVVTVDGKTQYTHADAGYAIWLEGAPGTLHGFCK